jgi:hypothetical protein
LRVITQTRWPTLWRQWDPVLVAHVKPDWSTKARKSGDLGLCARQPLPDECFYV